MFSVFTTRGQQQHYNGSHRNQAESTVNSDGTSRSKSVKDSISFKNGPQLGEMPPGGCEGQQEFSAQPVGVALNPRLLSKTIVSRRILVQEGNLEH